MASTARDMAQDFAPPKYLGPVFRLGGGRGVPSDQTARALTSAGLAALILLPILLLASLVLQAPIAVPAAIALGYLAMAHAVAFGRPRRAAALSAAVLTGFVAWTIFVFLTGEGPLSWSGLAAVALSPLFAAAPALARRIAQPTRDAAGQAARTESACLDRLAPSEAVIFLDNRGTVLGGTKAGFASLGLGPDAMVPDVARRFQLPDRAALIQALERCAAGAQPVHMDLQLEDEGRSVRIELTPNLPGQLAMRIRVTTAGESAAGQLARAPGCISVDQAVPEVLSCNVGEAIAFAMRHAAPKARARGIRIACDAAADIAAAVDRRACRVMANALLDEAAARCAANSEVRIAARLTRGAVLVRIGFQPDASQGGPAEEPRATIVHRSVAELVDQAGGTVLVEPPDPSGMLSIRLALPAVPALGRTQ